MGSVDFVINISDHEIEHICQTISLVQGMAEKMIEIAKNPISTNPLEGLNETTANLTFQLSSKAQMNKLENIIGITASE